MSSLTQELAKFAAEIEFDDLPQAVVHEAKRVLLDSIGCALAGITTDKGKISTELARRLGGPPESSIISTGDKVSCSNAAFANGELINALDYDSILFPPGHVTPYVIPAPLAVAESVGASGRDLILATALGHEVAARISRSLTALLRFVKEGPEEGSSIWSPVYGVSQCIFGGTVGVGKILKLNHNKMAHALGIAGHLCPVRAWGKWQESMPSAMTKYGPAGWISSGAVTAALMAGMGYFGDTTVLDGDYGFWRFSASERWKPDTLMEKIGETWLFLEIEYKSYPCCQCMHGALDCFTSIIDQNHLMPEDIESVNAFCHPLVDKPLWGIKEFVTHVDAQFSVAYVFAVTAHKVKLGDWQDSATMSNPKIQEFMKKVSHQAYPGFKQALDKDLRSRPAMVEVVAKGKTFREERMYHKGTPFTDGQTTDAELAEKFRNNASRILTRDKIDAAVKSILELEKVANIAELMKQVTL